MNLIRLWLVTIAILAAAPQAALAQPTYPSKPIRFIIPFAPGGATDIMARMIGQKLTEAWGQPVVVESKPGANGIIASEATAKAAPDGYTMLLAVLSTHATNVSLYSKLPYDPVRDFTPVVLMAYTPLVLVVPAASPFKSVKDLVDAARAKPGQLNFSAGTATIHLTGELFKSVTGTDITAVPYKGTVPGLMAVMSGEVGFTFEPPVTALPQIKGGRVRALAVTSPRRSPLLPDVPTVQETGVPSFEAYSWFGIMMPAGVPREITAKMESEVLRILTLPDIKEKLAASGLDLLPMTGERFAAFAKIETEKWAKTIKASGMKIE
ncbi:MAG: tripartite tricarboxylate transporter substrate binding protein [Polaromonas sp.]|nr:tripartite tricarboxylate transporter substrate binding protein [Burkholderiales bacterium]MDO8441954.1 tripartite tricarboxylate transporter substrate binding protein [Polaromonas sp.]